MVIKCVEIMKEFMAHWQALLVTVEDDHRQQICFFSYNGIQYGGATWSKRPQLQLYKSSKYWEAVYLHLCCIDCSQSKRAVCTEIKAGSDQLA
jgi:hypothetical protein